MPTAFQNAQDIAVLKLRVDTMEKNLGAMTDTMGKIAEDVTAIRTSLAINKGVAGVIHRGITFMVGIAGVAAGYFGARH